MDRLDRRTFRPLGWSWQGKFHYFEGARMENTEIGWAIQQMRNGAKVRRRGWNGPGQSLALQVPDEGSKMTLPYIFITTVQGDLVPWLASQTDILANDWEIAP